MVVELTNLSYIMLIWTTLVGENRINVEFMHGCNVVIEYPVQDLRSKIERRLDYLRPNQL